MYIQFQSVTEKSYTSREDLSTNTIEITVQEGDVIKHKDVALRDKENLCYRRVCMGKAGQEVQDSIA